MSIFSCKRFFLHDTLELVCSWDDKVTAAQLSKFDDGLPPWLFRICELLDRKYGQGVKERL